MLKNEQKYNERCFMTNKKNVFFIIAVIAAILAPEFANARGGWGAFGGALVGTAVVGSAIANSNSRAEARAARQDYYTQRELREVQAINYEGRLANQKLYDENQRQRETIRDLQERMNNIEGRMGNQRTEQREREKDEYSY